MLQNLPVRARLRVISAGATHNLCFWFLLAFLSSAALGPSLWYLAGYDSVGHYARVISSVDVVRDPRAGRSLASLPHV